MKTTRVLIVEDDSRLAEDLRAGVALYVLDAETTPSLAEANRRLGASAPAVGCVVLDLMLDDATGIAAVERLREAHPLVPIVVLTGHAELRVAAVTAGAQDALLKPTTVDHLVDAIQMAIARTRVGRRFEPHTAALAVAQSRIEGQLSRGGEPPPLAPEAQATLAVVREEIARLPEQTAERVVERLAEPDAPPH